MTTIVYVLLLLGTKANNVTVDAYSQIAVFSTETACEDTKQALEVKLRTKFDKLRIECKKKEVIK